MNATIFPRALLVLAVAGVAACQSVGDSDQLDASDLPLVRTMDERFQSFQIGMSHLTGGETYLRSFRK